MNKHVAVGVLILLLGRLAGYGQEEGPDMLFKNGVGQFAAQNYAEAARYFSELISRFGNEPELQQTMEGVYYAHGCALYNLGKYADAIEVFKAYAQKYPAAKYVDEALFRIGSAHQQLEAHDVAVKAYEDLIAKCPRSVYAEDGAFQIGMCYMLQDHSAKAAEAFAAFMVNYPESELWAQAGAFTARALFDQGKLADSVKMLQALEQRGRNWKIVVYVNFLAFEIGDAAFDETEYDLALRAYRRVQTRQALLRLQQRLVADRTAALEAFQREKPRPEDAAQRFRLERRMVGDLAQANELLKKLEGMPDYDGGLFHRIGRCFFNTDRFWEARVAFTRVVQQATEETIRESAHFDLVLVLSRLRLFNDLIEEATRYLSRYDPQWKHTI